ncbi:hypothetical protein DACRYDRAFT_48619 [Dacryopinax primogenitus]|uniref:RhoGAP-domain-containing protein n=1 Tax=Dacryopinax primogenitus (strain DJM 731) TaxID=1858805 RepID=M5G1B2_DACPD|nr:uncharacterized protein DACRYDRAFT_48619 [Dacryopinax primogenitus]EJU04026.1 hypothetical protein DACRYDRAFT_48619 [Dacryopinax primogenitus]
MNASGPAASNWGANFWVTITDPQTQATFYACPATGAVSWDPPENTFLLPPSTEGEWWELKDESRGGLSYFYHTRTGETVWERPGGFVIPLGMIQQNSALGKRLSFVVEEPDQLDPTTEVDSTPSRSLSPTSSFGETIRPSTPTSPRHPSALQPRPSLPNITNLTAAAASIVSPLQAFPSDADGAKSLPASPLTAYGYPNGHGHGNGNAWPNGAGHHSQGSASSAPPPSVNGHPGHAVLVKKRTSGATNSLRTNGTLGTGTGSSSTPSSPSLPTAPPSPLFPRSASPRSSQVSLASLSPSFRGKPPSPLRPLPGAGGFSQRPGTAGSTKAQGMSVTVGPQGLGMREGPRQRSATLSSVRSSTHPTLPPTLQDDIKKFATSEYARKFFSQRSRGFWFLKRRKIPVDETMRWQRSALDGPLLVMNGSLHKDAVAAFKVVQRIMGDRDPLKPIGVGARMASQTGSRGSPNSSFSSVSGSTGPGGANGDGNSIIEEERWLLQAGISHTELRDEIYCQVMKQLTENPNTDSAFRGWQLLCVLIVTFPPSKYFEDHLTHFLHSSMHNTEGKVDVMAGYCLRRQEIIMWKGPRGKAPSLEEIEAAADAAFHPSVFGESLPLIMSLQATVYPPSEQPVPIILPFLSSGILALGGMKEEGIFRLPGDTDAVASLRLRIERGHYHLEGVEDPHVCASLMKSWLRELREPVIPEGQTYNLALQAAASDNPNQVLDVVRHLPEPNRRVLLHVISFLQLFVGDEVVEHTKMTEEGLARVMTPNLIRGRTDDLDVAFRNNHFENVFVGMLLRHMDCSTVDPGYRPMHGRA